MSNLKTNHLQHLTESAISIDIAALNFYSWDGCDENGVDNVFDLLVKNPKYRNNGTLSGGANNALANVIRDGGWVFEGHIGVSVKPDNPREVDTKTIKYESVRGCQQLFVPRVSVRAAMAIAAKLDVDREFDIALHPNSEDMGFWDWFRASGFPLIVTEGCKKACAVVSAGYPAIALNGVYGWGSNDRDMFGNLEVGVDGNRIKTVNVELVQFIADRETILAFDVDSKPKTVAYVNRALQSFAVNIADISSSVSQLRWTGSKGIDDLIATKGVKNLDKIYIKRMEVKPVEEKSDKKPTAWHLTPKVALDVYAETIRYDDTLNQYWEYSDGLWKYRSDNYVFSVVKAYLDTVTEDYPTRLVNETIAFAKGSILISDWIEADNTKFIPFKNGVLEVETMQLLPHSPSYGFRWQMPREYSVINDGWDSIDKFLNEFSDKDPLLKNVLLAFCNAAIMGRSDLQKFLFLSGSGGNGKGVFMNLLKSLVGEDNTRTSSLASLNDNRFEAANIKNKRLVLCPDEDKRPESLTVFKSATGGDNISCEFKGKQSIDFRFGGIFIVAANQAIFKGENHEAMKRRKVDFPCKHRPQIKDYGLVDRLILELPAFTTYVLSLDPDWVELTIRESGSVPAIAELARDMSIREDSVAAYFEYRLVYDANESTRSGLMYKDYQSYCQDTGLKPLSGNNFPGKLIELCRDSKGLAVSKKETKSGNIFMGLRLATVLDGLDDPVVKAVEAGGGIGGGINPILRKESGSGGGISPYFLRGRIEEENKNIEDQLYRCDGVLASTDSTNSLEPAQDNNPSLVEASTTLPPASTLPQIEETHPIFTSGERVMNALNGKKATVIKITRLQGREGRFYRVRLDNGDESYFEQPITIKAINE